MVDPVRIIPRLDLKGENLIKPIQFDGQRALGEPTEFAIFYCKQFADEILIQDTVASLYRRSLNVEALKKICRAVDVPVTVAGGITSVNEVRDALHAGADKVAINTGAVANPDLIGEVAKLFGSQCIVGSIDYYTQYNGSYEVWTDGGRERTEKSLFLWAQEMINRGAGELLVSAIAKDGLGSGFDISVLRELTDRFTVPIIGSCGAGTKSHFHDAITKTAVSGLCAASVFHYSKLQQMTPKTNPAVGSELRVGDDNDVGNFHFVSDGYGSFTSPITDMFSIIELKTFLNGAGVAVRIPNEGACE